MRTFPLPPLTIEVVEGDISIRQVDAVVNAANNALWMGSGVAGAIKARGGDEIEKSRDGAGADSAGRGRPHDRRPAARGARHSRRCDGGRTSGPTRT